MKLTLDLPSGTSPDALRGYCLFYQLERWLREMVYLELKAHFGENWWTEAEQALKRSRGGGIPAARSLRADKRHPHMSTPENDPLWFLSLDSLTKIILDKKLWRLFGSYLTTKSLVKAKFDEIAPIRNRIAHYRALHKDDIDRIVAVLRDIDEGFWRFCTSYNNNKWFVPPHTKDPVFEHFADRQHRGMSKTSDGKWVGPVGILIGVDVNIELLYSFRPSARARKTRIGGHRGALYDFTFSAAHHHDGSRILDYPRIISATRHHHRSLIHILLDSFQSRLRVTFPAVAPSGDIIQAAEAFYAACLHNRGGIYYRRSKKDASPEESDLREYEENLRPYELIAAEWPHYVVPPGNPFNFLGPDMPCRFFQAV